jgi:cytidylate kinase
MRAVPTSVICISHSEGAEGPAIGKLLAELTGLRYVDDGVLVEAARTMGLYPEAVSLAESRRAKRQLEVDFNRFERTETVRALIRAAITATADEGDVVIIAHAASYALAGRPNLLRVLVTASDETRSKRVAEAEDVDHKAAAKILTESDKGRAAYLKDFYGVHRERPTDYDLVINTDRLDPAAAAATIARAAGAPATPQAPGASLAS